MPRREGPTPTTPRLFAEPCAEGDPIIRSEPIGTVLRAARGRWGLATASYDETQKYRYRLSRIWDESKPRVCWVMLNPSTATELQSDPTVERTLRFSKKWGYGAVEVVNLFAYRATEPREMIAQADPVGEGNDEAIKSAAQAADLVVAAWGVHAKLMERGVGIRQMLEEDGVELSYLRITKSGEPGHPLYLPGNLLPVRWVAE